MASASPLKLTIEEQVPFTPPRSLRRSLPVPTSSRDLNRSSSIESRSVSSTPGEDEVENGQENIQMNNTSINTSINRGLGGGKKGRRKGCGHCQGCLAQDCGKCKMCRDKVKFGGPGIKKQKCLFRKCHHLMRVPSFSLSPAGPSRKRERGNEAAIDSLSPITSARKRRCTVQYRLPSSSSESSDSCVMINTDQLTANADDTPTNTVSGPLPLINKIFNPPTGVAKNWLSPCKRSPLKAGASPRKKNSQFGKQQQQQQPLTNKQTTSIDSAPFNNLLHIRQEEETRRLGSYHYSILDRLRLIPDKKLIPIPSTSGSSLGSITEVACVPQEKEKSENVVHNNEGVSLSAEGLELFKRYQTLSKALTSGPSGCQGDCHHGNHSSPLNVSIHILDQRKRKRGRGRKNEIKVDVSHYSTTQRYSKRLRARSDKEAILDDPPPPPEGEGERVSSRLGHELWTDCYAPHASGEVVGDKGSVSILLNWLKEWKEVCVGKCLSLNESLSSSILSEEEPFHSLSPVMIVSGPTGAGKTACVYACAAELGYRVLEINTTHSRNRQNIISLLREATLSHQVALKGKTVGMREPHLPAPPPPKKGILSFFSSKAPVQSKPLKQELTPREEEKVLTLETTSLVLIEEVDLLFEDEVRGFWIGLYDILSTTKRPVILTTNDIGLKLDTHYQSINMATPSKDEVSLHVQLLSMSHDYHMTTELANQITDSLGCDIRKVFSTLHFWLAGHTLSDQPVKLDNVIVKKPQDPITSLILGSPPISNSSSMYHELDEAVLYTDALLAADIWNGLGTDTSRKWRSKESLSEELSETDTALNMEEWESVLLSSMGMRTGFRGTLSGTNKNETELESLRRKVSLDVFHVRTVLSRQSLATDCLPVLKLICDYENDRKLAKTSRRFSHYLMQNNLDHLEQFLYSNTLSFMNNS